ncbi:MAG: hypothetical protein ABJD07_06245 [Gemmatimonadaceae bacterium]
MNARFRAAAIAVALTVSAACAGNPRAGVIYAHRAPPTERIEVVSVAPGREDVWVKGHWAWRRDDYDWIPGHWARAQAGSREYVPGRWEHDRFGWFWIEGRWR